MRWLFIGGGVILLGIILVALFKLTAPQTPRAPAARTATTTGGILPTAPATVPPATAGSATTSPSFALGVQGGGSIAVNDFLNNGETVPDVENEGVYYLAGSVGYCLADGTCPHGATTTAFSISYNSRTFFFNIRLLEEPLGQSRQSAERFLEDRLGLGEQDLCRLNYYVGTTAQVNPVYVGKNLGFSFCMGATTLPQ